MDHSPNQRVEINSPGHILLYSKSKIPLIIAAIISLTSIDISAKELTEDKFIVTNSSDNSKVSNDCTVEINKEILAELNAMGYELWEQACKLAKDINENTGIETGVQTKKSNSSQ